MRITIIRNIKSIDKLAAIVIGLIKEDKPNINNMLKVLDPNIFPRAMSFSPFLAATKEVTSSEEKYLLLQLWGYQLIFHSVLTLRQLQKLNQQLFFHLILFL